MNKKQQLLFSTIVMGSIVLGGLLVIYTKPGEYQWEQIGSAFLGTVLGFSVLFFFSKGKKKKNAGIPEADERTIFNLQKYFMGSLYILLVGSGAALLIAFMAGVRFIETEFLILCLAVVYIVLGLGSVLAKRL